jgi:dipeptidase E
LGQIWIEPALAEVHGADLLNNCRYDWMVARSKCKMRMYLSSFDLGNRPEALQELVGSDRRAAIVMNALDNFPDQRARWLEAQSHALMELGFSVSELDLRTYFGHENDLRGFAGSINTIWVNGGNAFILRRAMKHSGFDAFIKDALALDTHVYAGFSAAAVVCYQSMMGLELTDDPKDTPQGYAREIVWEGLDLLPYAIAVHYKSDHPESSSTDREIAFYKANGIPYRALRDGQALVVNGATADIIE